MLKQQKLIYKIIDDCNNYQKLRKINKEITALLKIAQNSSLLNDLSIMKEQPTSVVREDNLSLKNSTSIPEKSPNKDSIDNNKVKNIKNNIKLQLKILMSVIAHKMDPVKRAGETTASNKRDAKKFGRSPAKSFRPTTLTTMLFKMILNQIKLILETSITSSNNSIENQSEINIDMEQKSHLPNIASNKNNQQTRIR